MLVCDKILINASIISCEGLLQEKQAIIISKGFIVWCGHSKDLPENYASQINVFEDCQDQLVTPGLIDSHTHLVYAGDRADEFKLRLEGVSYAEIAKRGGGIVSTVKQTRAATKDQLLEQSLPRLQALLKEGVTTVEIKSGYGLDLENEIKMLQVARQLGEISGVRVKTTFLGAHAVPDEFKPNSQAYVNYLCEHMLPAVVDLGLADAVDVFCETIGFSLAQTEQLFFKAQALNLPIKCHAEQLSNLGASELAAHMGALSCDHLEFLDRKGALAMAKNDTVAVLLPGAFYFLREKTPPPIALLRELGIRMAIASDCNPGSSPTTSLLLMMSMACRFFGLTVQEALAGVTFQAAKALGLEKEIGKIAPGYAADLVKWSITDSSSLCYYFGYSVPHQTMIAGKWI